MKLEMEDVRIIKTTEFYNQLKNEFKALGFNIVPSDVFDLYVEKGNNKRAYLIALGEDNKLSKEQYYMYQEEANKIGAKLFIINAKLPQTNLISFEGIEDIILEDMANNLPTDLYELSHNAKIKNVDRVIIEKQNTTKGGSTLEGYGYVNISLQSADDKNKGTEKFTDPHNFYFDFMIRLDRDDNIISSNYDFNLDDSFFDE